VDAKDHEESMSGASHAHGSSVSDFVSLSALTSLTAGLSSKSPRASVPLREGFLRSRPLSDDSASSTVLRILIDEPAGPLTPVLSRLAPASSSYFLLKSIIALKSRPPPRRSGTASFTQAGFVAGSGSGSGFEGTRLKGDLGRPRYGHWDSLSQAHVRAGPLLRPSPRARTLGEKWTSQCALRLLTPFLLT
jgi:hypothetical protein